MYRIYDKVNDKYCEKHEYAVNQDKQVMRLHSGKYIIVENQQDYIVERATGFNDINDKEICDGDVITSKEYPYQLEDGIYNYHGVIEYDENTFWRTYKLVNKDRNGISHNIGEELFSIMNPNNLQVEIIGTIHDEKFKHLVNDDA